MIKPIRTLLLVFYTACIVAVIAALSPEGGELKISDDFSLKIFSFSDLSSPEPATQEKDVADKISALQAQVDSLEIAAQNRPQPKPDESQAGGLVEKVEPVIDPKFPIQYADSTNPAALKGFFKSLLNLSEKPNLVRVVHYGDSQIEGDRMSEYLRTRLQRHFGGCGVGLLPIVEKQAFRTTVSTDFDKTWSKYAPYGDNPKSKAGRYGLLASVYKFSPVVKPDSTDGAKTYRAWLRFRQPRFSANKKESRISIENVKILLYSPFSNVSADLKIKADRDTTIQNFLYQESKFICLQQPVKTKFEKLDIQLETGAGSEFYGVALDCDYGIAVDNVPMRGSSGVEFNKIDKEIYKQQIQKLNVKLLILQFGVNVIPNVVSDYTFYENMFYNQLRFLKSIDPELSILVVGVSDMARRQGTGYASYPNVTKVRDAQKRAAFRAGCAFWDLYEAMGGHNSMVSWVNNKPTLATRDYIHFNDKGARLVSEMLYNAVMKEYENYKKEAL